MRHKAQVSHFGRRTGGRWALIRGLVFALVRDGRIKTTLPKAKELKRHAERAVTTAKGGTLNDRRLLLSTYPSPSTVKTLVDDLAPRFKDRAGGYTRIIRIGKRPGDNAEMAYIEWLDYAKPSTENEEGAPVAKAKKKPAKIAKTAKAAPAADGEKEASAEKKKKAPAKKAAKAK